MPSAQPVSVGVAAAVSIACTAKKKSPEQESVAGLKSYEEVTPL